MRREFLFGSLAILAAVFLLSLIYPPVLWSLVLFLPIIGLGLIDYFQTRKTIRRNYPFIGRARYLFELIRPEIHQYFVESNSEGVPFSREERSIVYQRAKKTLDTLPFGTQKDVYANGYEWVNHSLLPTHLDPDTMRTTIGGSECRQPYDASLLNISAMSYGSLSKHAVLALNGGAKDGNFAHNTGEGAISPYHLENGGDLIWQIGTGYFGCRNDDGTFNRETYRENAQRPEVKMIEIKLSQGAKPGHGGILPAAKVSEEISRIRHVPMGRDVISPPGHSAFSTPIEMLNFIADLRDLSGGKPVGFKLCIGKRREFLAICKAMHTTGIAPDFIMVDGGEGGTGAAPLEFSNHVGTPTIDGLIFVHNALVGYSLRDKIKVGATGKVTTAFGMIKRLSLGADFVSAARSMMLALGCIQALKCNTNECPTGVATQNPHLTAGLVVTDKRKRVHMYHKETIESLAEILGAMGLESHTQLRPWHIMRRISRTEIHHYGEMFEFLNKGDLLKEPLPKSYARACKAASPDSFRHVEQQ